MNKDSQKFVEEIVKTIEEKINKVDSKESLNILFEIDRLLYTIQGQQSIRYGNGTHSKHKHINYHKFFMDNIESGESVLDIGSSFGELTSDIAKAANPGKVIGIEIEEFKAVKASETYKIDNLEFVHGDATKDLPDQKFDVITLSNVLEHIEDRVGILKILKTKYNPKKILIRVPVFERDWRVPLKKELGLDYRLDDTHFIEYTLEIFKEETSAAGLEIVKLESRWGEIWSVLR